MLMPANDHAAFALFKSYIRDASGISEDEFNLIAHFLRPVHFNKGAVVLEIGSVCAHAFHVTRGLLRVATLDKNGDCLLYTSDAADERSSVDLGGRRIIKKKTTVSIKDKDGVVHKEQTMRM